MSANGCRIPLTGSGPWPIRKRTTRPLNPCVPLPDAVQTLGAKVLETRPPLVEHVVETECNAHLLAHKLYGDFTRAAEIVRLNPQIRNPNFIAKGQLLNVYAD